MELPSISPTGALPRASCGPAVVNRAQQALASEEPSSDEGQSHSDPQYFGRWGYLLLRLAQNGKRDNFEKALCNSKGTLQTSAPSLAFSRYSGLELLVSSASDQLLQWKQLPCRKRVGLANYISIY